MKDVCAEYQTKEYKHLQLAELLEKFSKLVGQHPFKSKKTCILLLFINSFLQLVKEFETID